MNCASGYNDIGAFEHTESTIGTRVNATETGDHVLRLFIGKTIVTDTFTGTTDSELTINNIFPETGTYVFEIVAPSGAVVTSNSISCFKVRLYA
jgi:hypothetical protein